jgi:hypothetical protein
MEAKPKSFRWAPILADQPGSSVWIMNSSPRKANSFTAEIELTIFREHDASTLTRHLTLPPHGFLILNTNEDQELKAFLSGKVGWFTATSTNPYTTTYYFSENSSGMVGGDHGF